MANKIIKLYVWIIFLYGLVHSFTFATYTLYLKESGLSFSEINLVNVFFMLGVFLLEIPTGSIADRYGRKKTIVMGALAYALGMFIYFNANSFWGFVGAELLCALGATLHSGAMEAWMVDSLNHHGYEGSMLKVFRKESRARAAGVIIGSFIGGWLGQIDLSLPLLADTFGFLLFATYCMFVIREDYFSHQQRELKGNVFTIAHDSFVYGWKSKPIRIVVLFGGLMFLSMQKINMTWNIALKEDFDFAVGSIGMLFVAIQISILVGSEITDKIKSRVKDGYNAIITSQIITVIGMIAMSTFLNLPIFISMFLLHELGRGTYGPLKQEFLNHHINSNKRATILSFESMMTKGGGVLGLILTGPVAKEISLPTVWMLSSIFFLLCIIIFYRIKPHE